MEFYTKRLAYLIFSFTLLFTGCPGAKNQVASNSLTNKTSGISGGTAANLPNGNSEDALTIMRVARSNLEPNSLLDIVGQNGEIGSQCQSTTDCLCRYNFIESDGTLRQVDVIPGYVETDLMRCNFTQVSTTAKSIKVQIVINAANLTSNTVEVAINGINPSLDTGLNSNYVAVQRFMCRDHFTLNQNTKKYNGGLFDPSLWPIGYAYNFYTTSLGLDYGAVLSTGGEGGGSAVGGGGGSSNLIFECPPLPNDVNFDTLFDMRITSVESINLADPTDITNTGDNTIFPPYDNLGIGTCITGNEASCEKFKLNRHDFYLASFQDGIFRHPMCVIHKVNNLLVGNLNCKTGDGKTAVTLGSKALEKDGQDIIGFAAIPDANENCPDTNLVKIPPGKKWAKLWQFRTSLSQRTIEDVANPNDVGDLFCTTRKKECGAPDGAATALTTTCFGITDAFGPTIGPRPSASIAGIGNSFGNCNTKGLSSDGGQCTDTSAAQQHCCNDFGGNTVGKSGALFDNSGGNFCTPALVGEFDATGGLSENVWLMGNGERQACIEADTDSNGRLKDIKFPDKLQTYITTLKPLENGSRFDFLYVVTPPSIRTETMNNSEDPIRKKYTPQRRINADPNNSEVATYGIESGSLNNSNPTNRAPVFPLCVLQDAK